MKLISGGHKYLRIGLTKDGEQTIFLVHKLVAIEFLNHTPNGHIDIIEHIDNNKHNNNVSNLRISTTQRISYKVSNKSDEIIKLQDGKWTSYIQLFGRNIKLGFFNSEEEAINFLNKMIGLKNNQH